MVHLFLSKIGLADDSHLVSAPGLSGEGGKPWDYAAGTIIAMEAGAKICKARGDGRDVVKEVVLGTH